jgi:hypothetical protein
MPTVREPQPHPQARAVEVVADAIRVLRTRDGFNIPDELVVERARNAVTALDGEFELVERGPVAELIGDRRESIRDFVSAVDAASGTIRPEVA